MVSPDKPSLEETIFEINTSEETVKAVGIDLDVPLDKLRIYVNDIDINRTMKIFNLRIVKVL